MHNSSFTHDKTQPNDQSIPNLLKFDSYSFIQKKTRCDSHIVVETESHGFIVFGMMPRRSNNSKSRIQLSFRNSFCDLFNKNIK